MSWRMTEVCEVWLSMQWVTLMKQLAGSQMLAGFTSNDPLCVYQRLRLNPPSRPHRWSWRGPDWLMILMRRSPSGPDPWSWWRRRSCPLTLLPKRSSMVDNHKYCYILTDRRAWAFKKIISCTCLCLMLAPQAIRQTTLSHQIFTALMRTAVTPYHHNSLPASILPAPLPPLQGSLEGMRPLLLPLT